MDVETLDNDAKAITRTRGPISILGIDGTDACKNIYTLDEKAHGCPLRKGQTYLYKNEFEVLHNNPKVKNQLISFYQNQFAFRPIRIF